MRGGVGIDSSRCKFDGAWVVLGEWDIVMQEVAVASACHEGAGVHQGSWSINIVMGGKSITTHVRESNGGSDVNTDGIESSIEDVVFCDSV